MRRVERKAEEKKRRQERCLSLEVRARTRGHVTTVGKFDISLQTAGRPRREAQAKAVQGPAPPKEAREDRKVDASSAGKHTISPTARKGKEKGPQAKAIRGTEEKAHMVMGPMGHRKDTGKGCMASRKQAQAMESRGAGKAKGTARG